MGSKPSKVSVAIYVRVANITFDTYDASSSQLRQLINYANDILHADKIESYQDLGYSGTSLERPSFQKMMDGIKKDEFTHLLVFSSDRIARNMVDFIQVLKILKKYHVEFVSIKDLAHNC